MSVVNMSDALDHSQAMAKQDIKNRSIKQFKEDIKKLNATVYKPETDKQFYLYLNRLADAEKFKKTDRIDGRRALNDFILDHDSVMYVKGVKKAEQVKLQHQQTLKESKSSLTDNNFYIYIVLFI